MRDIIDRFGSFVGIKLKQDTKAKNEWNIDSHGSFDGGMVCKGYRGDINGRSADLLVFDDVLKNSEQALSSVVLDAQWEFYQTIAFSRLGPTAPIVLVTTRWVSGDLPGRIYKEAKQTGEKWKVINIPAIAEQSDPLGRQPGQALWPERVPLERLQLIQKTRNRWFRACWQQDPIDAHGMHFRPRKSTTPPESNGWPVYWNSGDAWWLPDLAGPSRRIVRHSHCNVIIGVDWSVGKKAIRPKKHSDYTAFVVAILTPEPWDLLIAEVINERIPAEDHAKRLAQVCEKYSLLGPVTVASEDDMLSESVLIDCRRYRSIPEIRRLPIAGHNKLVRAQAAIIRGETAKIRLPHEMQPWMSDFCDQLEAFTGIDDEHDDMVDALGVVGRLADSLVGDLGGAFPDVVASAGKMEWWRS